MCIVPGWLPSSGGWRASLDKAGLTWAVGQPVPAATTPETAVEASRSRRCVYRRVQEWPRVHESVCTQLDAQLHAQHPAAVTRPWFLPRSPDPPMIHRLACNPCSLCFRSEVSHKPSEEVTLHFPCFPFV